MVTHDLRAVAGPCTVPWAVVAVRGGDAEAYLQGQLSQDISGLAVGATTWTLLLQPTGKVDAWLRLTRTTEDGYLLDAPCADPGPVVTRLERFRLRMELDIEPLDRTVVSVRGPGASALAAGLAVEGPALPAGWPGVEGVDLVHDDTSPAAPDLAEAEIGAWEALRVECGVPLNGRDLGPDTIPAEAGQWLIDASVSFTKGCFTGQELVARIDSRGGNVPRPLRGLVLTNGPSDGFVTGAELALDGRTVGQLTSAATSPVLGPIGLGRVNRSVEPGTEVEVTSGDGSPTTASVRALPLR